VETTGTTIAVVYDEGVFKPQEPVPVSVKPRQILHLRVPDDDAPETEAREIKEGWDAVDRLIGLADDEGGPTDVAENHDKYLYGGLRRR
jgi:predicted DNA-binding antitoxin AbrB/MazE fold protein